MKDEALTTSPELSLADAAILYLLKRVQVDAKLRYLMHGTETFARLCAAEAHRNKRPAKDVEDQYLTLTEHCRSDHETLRKNLRWAQVGPELLEACKAALADPCKNYSLSFDTEEMLRRVVDLAEGGD